MTTTVAAPTVTVAPAQAAKPAADDCASATKAALEAGLKADAQASGALIVDGKGLRHITCAAPWAFARFSNHLDGGQILFRHVNGAWIPQNWGTGELCEKVPPAIAHKICS